MGKTLLAFSSLIEQERRRWTPFKKVLPKAGQPISDRLFDCAKLHIQPGVMSLVHGRLRRLLYPFSGSWPLLVKRVPHGMLPSAAEEVVHLSHLARGFPTPSPPSGAVTSDLSLVTAVVRHVPRPQLAVPPLVPGGVARAAAHVGPIGSGG